MHMQKPNRTLLGSIDKTERKDKKFVFDSMPPVESSIKWDGRSRGRTQNDFKCNPDAGWRIDTNTAKFHFKRLNNGCSNTRSNAAWLKKTEAGLAVRAKTVTDLGRRSVCTTRTTITFTQLRTKSETKTIATPKKNVTTNNDIKFSPSKVLKKVRLSHIEISSPMFENGTKILRPNEDIGGLKLDYDKASKIGFLRFEYSR